MPRFIIHHDGMFAEWSTIVDAPITYFMDEDTFREYYEEEYGKQRVGFELEERLTRARKNGTSSFDDTLETLIRGNRAGENEETLTLTEIIRDFTQPKRLKVEPKEDPIGDLVKKLEGRSYIEASMYGSYLKELDVSSIKAVFRGIEDEGYEIVKKED